MGEIDEGGLVTVLGQTTLLLANLCAGSDAVGVEIF